jgi:hypothetical protein
MPFFTLLPLVFFTVQISVSSLCLPSHLFGWHPDGLAVLLYEVACVSAFVFPIPMQILLGACTSRHYFQLLDHACPWLPSDSDVLMQAVRVLLLCVNSDTSCSCLDDLQLNADAADRSASLLLK